MCSAKAMSALPPKADMCSATRHVRFVPIADISRCYSITSLACAGADGHSKTKRLGGLEIDHQLELSRRLHRQVGRFFAFQDTIDVVGSRRY